jgi:hypothetical protein
MEPKQDPQENTDNFCKCPHCACCFCTEADLKKHLEVLGEEKTVHAGEFQRIHGRLEHGSFGGPE